MGHGGPHVPATPRAAPGLTQHGSKALPEIFAFVEKASVADLRRAATDLLSDPRRRRDLGVWGPLLARWAEMDGAGLMAFVRNEAPPGDRPWLESKAWYAWGAADPQAAGAEGAQLPVELSRQLIAGMAQADVRAAVAFAMRMPDAQFNLRGIAGEITKSAPELIGELLLRSVYDGMREPLQRAQCEVLARTDPPAAIALARRLGAIERDLVPETMGDIAQRDPLKAVEVLAQMPSSRSRALSAVTLAKTWAAHDAIAATAWARQTLTGSVKQSALLEIAAVSGGPDPLASLQLVEEAGWIQESNFYRIADGGSLTPSETFDRPTPVKTTSLLLRQLSVLDPSAARNFLEQRVPESLRQAVAQKAGLSASQ